MGKIGVVTVNDFNNYGNRLQCYAVQAYLERLGHSPENIFNKSLEKKIWLKAIRTVRREWQTVVFWKNRESILKRKENFEKFNERIHFSQIQVIDGIPDKKIGDFYDFFIVGSDQVWSPDLHILQNAYSLEFASSKKRISFSASFGSQSLPIEYHKDYKKFLSEFSYISVREEAGRDIVQSLTNRTDIEVLIDPTMLLSAEEWDRIAQKPDWLEVPEKYILLYFLGNIAEETRQMIDQIANEYDCEIINLYDRRSIFYSCGPAEFLYLEKHAFCICTDSFHSSVFAIIYDRPFIVFERKGRKIDMGSRFDTLISIFELKNRRYNKQILVEEYLNHDYSEAYTILEKEKKKAEQFFSLALGDLER